MGIIYDFMDEYSESTAAAVAKTVAVYALMGTVLCGALHHISYSIKRSIDIENAKVDIEANIRDSAGLSKFTARAITVSKQNDEHFVEMFGVGIETPGSTPKFLSLTYGIDKDLYEKMFKYIDIQYTYGPDGQIVDAEYTMRTNLGLFGKNKADKAEAKILKALVETTKQHVISKQIFGETSVLTNINTDVAINNISKPIISDNKKISFLINAFVEKKENGKSTISEQTLRITQDLTPEILNNTSIIYVNYIANKNIDVEIIGERKANLENDIKQNYSIELPDGMCL